MQGPLPSLTEKIRGVFPQVGFSPSEADLIAAAVDDARSRGEARKATLSGKVDEVCANQKLTNLLYAYGLTSPELQEIRDALRGDDSTKVLAMPARGGSETKDLFVERGA